MEYPTGIVREGCVFGDVTEVKTIFRSFKTEPAAFGNIDIMEYPKAQNGVGGILEIEDR